MSVKITYPIGRLVWGSLYSPETKDFDGNPLTVKTPGPDFGKPTVRYTFGVAIAKEAGKQWWETVWGAEIHKEASASFPNGAASRPGFSFKITDGDSGEFKKGSDKAINTQPGRPGHWVLSFSSSFPPKLYATGTDGSMQQLTQEGFIKTGYYVQVAGSVSGNGNQNNPGVFLNHDMVHFSAYGEEIGSFADPTAAGFGGALPVGASATPIGGNFNPASPALPSATPAAPSMPSAPASPGAVGLAAPVAPTPPVLAPAPVVPVDPLVQVPGAQYTIAQCREAKWTDDQIVAQGYATRVVSAPAGVVPVPSFLNGPQ